MIAEEWLERPASLYADFPRMWALYGVTELTLDAHWRLCAWRCLYRRWQS